jgi:hypothetical protein
MLSYSYTVLKYRHDPVAEEVLNVGVVLYVPDCGQIGVLYDRRYGRLSQTFAHFDGNLYRSVLRRLEDALAAIAKPLSEGLYQVDERDKFRDVGTILRAAWPDQGLSYFSGRALPGLTEDPEAELKELYDRFVVSQQDPRDATERFDDRSLWDQFRALLTPRGIEAVLQPKTLGSAEVEFEHAYKNEKWHVIEPVSLDYAHASDIKERALLAFGKAAAVKDDEELASITVIVGQPRRQTEQKPFLDALRLLHDLPGPRTRVVVDDRVEEFAAELEEEMRRHGVLT